MASEISRAVVNAIRNNGYTYSGNRLVVLFSGGGDSVALLAAMADICDPTQVVALHVNYGLRGAESDADEQFCRDFCDRLGVSLHVEYAPPDFALRAGNLQDRARDLRYEAASKLAAELGCDRIAVAHTADDQAETQLYRLFASPGRDSLRGMEADARGIMRPFLNLRRRELREWCRERGLDWREDSSNLDPRFARVRARKLLADAESLHPAAVSNLLTTMDELREESLALDAVVDQLVDELTTEDGRLPADRLASVAPVLAKRVLRAFVKRDSARPVRLGEGTLEEVLRLARAGGSAEVQFEGGSVFVEYGEIVAKDPKSDASSAEPTALPVPGAARFGDWEFDATTGVDTMAGSRSQSGFSAELEVAPGGSRLLVRGRRPGDRIRPRGLGGSKSLQDIFVDAKVPRRLRERHPVICDGDRILWVPGLAVAETSGADASATVTVTATLLH